MNHRLAFPRPVIFSLIALFVAGSLLAFPGEEKASLSLEANRSAYSPSERVQLAALVTIDKHWHVNSNTPTFDYLIPTEISVVVPTGWPEAEVTYPKGEIASFTFAEEPLSVYQGRSVIQIDTSVPAEAAGSATVEVTLTYQACNDTQCLPPVRTSQSIDLKLEGGGTPTNQELFGTDSPNPSSNPASTSSASPQNRSLLTFLLLGALGGLILNAMPCVLPILSIKVFSLVKSASLSRREVVRSGLATASGILVSFWALAGAAIIARSAGRAVGWGVQFQEPIFVAVLSIIVLLFTLNMWGLFEIQLPGRLSQLGGSGPQEGVAGHFVSGLFATLMATPCSAPFLGTAVGFALAQPPVTILAIFTAVGIGMAAPYLLLAAWPGSARFLPKPGAWMLRLREVMGFLLAAAAVWLFYVLAGQISAERVAMIELSLLFLCLTVWLHHTSQTQWFRRVAMVAILGAASTTIWLAASAQPLGETQLAATGGHIAWTPFDLAEADRRVASGTAVFVDVTADWCFTCKVNERFVLDTPTVAEAFAQHDVIPMQADWTNRNQEISEFLATYDRYGIPFYLLFRPGAEPFVFGELLTEATILEALATLK